MSEQESEQEPRMGSMAASEEERQQALKVLEASWATFADIPDEELEQEIGRAIGEVRARERSQRAA